MWKEHVCGKDLPLLDDEQRQWDAALAAECSENEAEKRKKKTAEPKGSGTGSRWCGHALYQCLGTGWLTRPWKPG